MFTLPIVFFLAGFGYLIRGGTTTLTGKEIPHARYVGCAVSTLAFAIYTIASHESLWLIPAFAVGWFFTIAFAWGDYFQCRTWGERVDFYFRMWWGSFPLFQLLALIKYNSLDPISPIVFALITTVVYTGYNKLPAKWRTDTSLNWSEFLTGITITGLAIL